MGGGGKGGRGGGRRREKANSEGLKHMDCQDIASALSKGQGEYGEIVKKDHKH